MNFSHFQEGAARYEMAMRGIPDRVPVCAQLHALAMKQLGVSALEFYTHPELIVDGTLTVQERLGIDVPSIYYDVYNIEAEALGQKMFYQEARMPDVDRDAPLLQSEDDLGRITTPDFESQGRFPMVLALEKRFQDLTGLEPELQFTAPFSLAANLRGIEPLLIDAYTNETFLSRLIERLTELVVAPWILHQKSRFPKASAITGSDATASLPIVSPRILESWVMPAILRLKELCGSDVTVANWTGESRLANPRRMLDMKRQASSTYLLGQDPDAEKLGPAFYKDYADEHNQALILGIGAVFLETASQETIQARVRDYVQVGGRGGKFALYLCNLSQRTPPANVRAAIEAVEFYGTYE
jgi:uroporphyrinogen-III decarboxylase